ncbi:M50 family metallopeptidase [Rhodotorula paludigena]|uniref:M50 family metallopeptidase n=1 Tax=Rhodotorula paludigena TaxID=86838 RepID=UPI00316D8257
MAAHARFPGWDTSTSTVWVTNTEEVPKEVTIYTTYGESPVVDGGTIVETVYRGASTLTVLGPSYLTLTFYPTTTTYSTSKTTIPTTTKTKTKTPAAQSTQTVCRQGDADEKEFTGLKPTHDQSITLYVIAIYGSLVGIAVGWNLFILRDLLYPFKVFTVAVHEMGHVLVTICMGGHIGVLVIDPKVGGLTRMAIKDARELPIPFAALPMGYLFSIIVGGVLTFCGFNTLASKIASFIVVICWIGVFLRVEVSAKIMTVLAVGLMVGLWFVDHAWGLRFYILFLGVMNSFYVLWDVADDAFFAKQNPSCPYLHWESMPALTPAIWTIIYVVLSFLFFIGFILAALAAWKQSPHAMYCQAQTFLPTR